MIDTQKCGGCKRDLPLGAYSPSYRGKRGTWCRVCFAANARGERVTTSHEPQTCTFCGATYVPKQIKKAALFCSRACKTKARNAANAALREANKPDRNCAWCSASMPKRMRSEARFCSEQCNSRAHQGTRKMWRRLGVPKGDIPLVSRSYLAGRDGFTCYLCGRRLRLETKHPDPGYASIDHVIPLSEGGTNELVNLRLAHLSCNVRKKASAMGEQLALIG